MTKLLLVWRGMIGLHPWVNLAFILMLAVPLPSRAPRILRLTVAIPLGIVLLYYDSWLPPLKRVLAQASSLSQFTFSYLIELTERLVHPEFVVMLVVIWILYTLVSRFLKLGVILTVSLFALAVLNKFDRGETSTTPSNMAQRASQNPDHSALSDLNYLVNSFFSTESTRQVSFDAAEATPKPFDIVLIHICSLSWSDLKVTGLENHPLWQTLDVLYTNFNSASSYSVPAAIRLLRAPCGQLPHAGLYNPSTDQCYLMESLKQAGFTPNLLLNHDGHFDNFLKTIENQKLGIEPIKPDGLRPYELAFDDSPIYDDKEVLDHWVQTRNTNPSKQVALYYNTISLHDGNRLVGPDNSLSSMKTYGIRLRRLLDDLNQFVVSLQNSGRNTVVVIIPEHGAAIRGDKYQISGLREIPTPNITLIPVGIKIIGPKTSRSDAQRIVSTPTSYLGLSQVIANIIKTSPFESPVFRADDLVRDMPLTKFVAQNADVTVVRNNGQYYLRQDSEAEWIPYEGEDK
ncbi:MAG: cellulose biosynthesis protein BcsG [Ferrovum myxofaciens]|nr:MAG: cellulose biosynthesis protein BcsG [Ferrovum myxofaciens]